MLSFLISAALALDNGLGRTPARGWNAWNSIRCEGLNEKLIREVADAMVRDAESRLQREMADGMAASASTTVRRADHTDMCTKN